MFQRWSYRKSSEFDKTRTTTKSGDGTGGRNEFKKERREQAENHSQICSSASRCTSKDYPGRSFVASVTSAFPSVSSPYDEFDPFEQFYSDVAVADWRGIWSTLKDEAKDRSIEENRNVLHEPSFDDAWRSSGENCKLKSGSRSSREDLLWKWKEELNVDER